MRVALSRVVGLIVAVAVALPACGRSSATR